MTCPPAFTLGFGRANPWWLICEVHAGGTYALYFRVDPSTPWVQLGPTWDAIGVASFSGSDNGQFSDLRRRRRRALPRGAALLGTERAEHRLIGRFEVGREETTREAGLRAVFRAEVVQRPRLAAVWRPELVKPACHARTLGTVTAYHGCAMPPGPDYP